MIQKAVLAVALVMTAMSASAHTVNGAPAEQAGENCWGTSAHQGQAQKLRLQQLRAQKAIMMKQDHPYTDIFAALEKFVPEPVEMNYDPNPEFNAYAQNFGGRSITMQLGVSTHKYSTIDASAMVACHELGHHFGGRPSGWGGMSVEGQSDFYGAQDCFKHWVNNSSPFDPKDQEASDYCEKNLGRRDTYCVRTMSASLHLARIIQDLKQHPMPYLTAKDPSVVSRTVTSHPQAQCRLDTYKAGFDFIESGKTLGENRPLCWFKPGGRVPLSLARNLLN